MLITAPLVFEFEEERVKIIFPVANYAQKEWLEIKMIPGMTEIFKSITGVNEILIQPIVKGEEEQIVSEPPITGDVILEDMTDVKSFIQELELEIKSQYDEQKL